MDMPEKITLRYVAIILEESDGGFFATVPDLGACFAYGRSIAEAKTDLIDALKLHMEGMRAEFSTMPPARHHDEILIELGYDIVEAYIVELDVVPLGRIRYQATQIRPS